MIKHSITIHTGEDEPRVYVYSCPTSLKQYETLRLRFHQAQKTVHLTLVVTHTEYDLDKQIYHCDCTITKRVETNNVDTVIAKFSEDSTVAIV